MKGKQIKQIIKEAINSLKKQKLNEQDYVVDTCYACFTNISFFNPNSPNFNQSAYDELLPMVDMETGLISGQGISDGNFGLCNVTLSYGANSNIGAPGAFNPSGGVLSACSPPLPSPTPDAGTMGGVKPGTPNLATPIKGPTKQPNVSPVGMAPKMPKRRMMREQINSLKSLNEQIQGNVPLSGACPAASLTLENPEQLFEITGININNPSEQLLQMYDSYIQLGNQNSATLEEYIDFVTPGLSYNCLFFGCSNIGGIQSPIINPGDTIKAHISVIPYLSMVNNLTTGYPMNYPIQQWASMVTVSGYGGIATEPQYTDSNFNPQYVFLNTEGTFLNFPSALKPCQHTQEDWNILTSTATDIDYLDPGVAPIPQTGTLTGMPGPSKPGSVSPVKPTKQPNVSPVGMAPKMPKRRMMREQVERMQKLANIKKKK